MVALADSQRGRDLVRECQRVKPTLYQRNTGIPGRFFGFIVFLLGRKQMQGNPGEVAVKPRQRGNQNHGQQKRDDQFLAKSHFARGGTAPRGRALYEVGITLSMKQFMVLFSIDHFYTRNGMEGLCHGAKAALLAENTPSRRPLCVRPG